MKKIIVAELESFKATNVVIDDEQLPDEGEPFITEAKGGPFPFQYWDDELLSSFREVYEEQFEHARKLKIIAKIC